MSRLVDLGDPASAETYLAGIAMLRSVKASQEGSTPTRGACCGCTTSRNFQILRTPYTPLTHYNRRREIPTALTASQHREAYTGISWQSTLLPLRTKRQRRWPVEVHSRTPSWQQQSRFLPHIGRGSSDWREWLHGGRDTPR